VTLTYARTFGYLEISAVLPQNEVIQALIHPQDGRPPFQIVLRQEGGRLHWKSQPLPTGKYLIAFNSSSRYIKPTPVEVYVPRGQTVLVTPDFKLAQSLRVKVNIPDALFTLRSENGSKEWRGQGRDYTFKEIPPGNYVLLFNTMNPQYAAPERMQINISPFPQMREVSANYQLQMLQERRTNQATPAPSEIIRDGWGKSELVIEANIPEASFSVQQKEAPQKIVGRFKGKHVVVPIEAKVLYVVIFDPISKVLNPWMLKSVRVNGGF
jgi:hypothetical protein